MANIRVKRLYPGMYLITNGKRELRITRQNGARRSGRWFITDTALFADALIDAEATYAEAKECAVAALNEENAE